MECAFKPRTGAPMPRAAALDLLDDILQRKRLLDDATAQSPAFGRLAERDRALAQQIVRTVLRRLGEIDALTAAFLDKPLGKKGRGVENIIRIGLAQLLFLDIPDHAAVDTAVELCQGGALAPYRKLVNAILRRAGREGVERLSAMDSARLNTPNWLWDAWTAAYGADIAHAIAEQHLLEPPLDITVKADPAAWAEALDAQLTPAGSLRLSGHRGGVTGLPGFADGAWWVQDMAASLPARLLGEVRDLDVVDLCAAPGGKTMELAAAGARVTAVDRSEKRLERVAENLARTGLSATLVAADAETWRPPHLADAVLLDAPCSATGTARRHPDVLRLKTPQDIEKLSDLQVRLLHAALRMVRPGGLVVYCTCSLQPEEGERQIEAFLKAGLPVRHAPILPHEAGALSGVVTAEGYLRTLPCHWAEHGGMDGFFAARLRRT
ncbi:MAG: methyltransferase domain-containing protein [Alphaproteobacteria bacterium]|nr:methyltransferase domain-containing protein [Alphaproteobacteria bacterium]MBF0250441.1 methyltransferase domain-containing protein [Alphaproteobacteria bacterium]